MDFNQVSVLFLHVSSSINLTFSFWICSCRKFDDMEKMWAFCFTSV